MDGERPLAKGESNPQRRDSKISREFIFAAGFVAAALIAMGWAWIGGDPEPVSEASGAATVGELMIIPAAERTMAAQVQMAAADFAGGGVFDLEASRGEIVVFYFMAAWCKTCEPEARSLARIQDKFNEQGVKVVIVDIDLTESDLELQGFSDRIGPNKNLWVFAGESDIVRKYGVKGLDGTIMIDRDGRIAHVDLYPTPYEVLDSLIAALL